MEKYKVESQKLFAGLSSNMIDVLYENKAIIAGGIVSRLFSGRSVEGADIDVYFRSKEDCAEALFAINGTSDIVFDYTDKSVMIKSGEVVVQFIIIGYFESAKEIFEKFDFTCVMGAYDTLTEEFIFHEDFLYHNAQRRLVYNPSTEFPIISALRVDKYKKEGYSISRNEFLKIILSLMNLKISTWEEAEKQFGKFYGVTVSNVITEELKQLPFSVAELLNAVSNYDFSESLTNNQGEKHIGNFEKFVFDTLGYKQKVYKFGNESYLVKSRDSGYLTVRKDALEDYGEIVDLLIDTSKLYKYVVQKKDGTLVSQWDNRFMYIIGEEASDNNNGLYFYYKDGLVACNNNYRSQDRVMIECEPITLKQEASRPDDVCRYSKVKVLRIVPKEEVDVMMSKFDNVQDNTIPF